MNKENKGSATILVILLLAFFMALSLNMFYIAQKKSERAGFKVIGQKDFAGIDESSTIGYNELYLAGELVNIGSVFPTENKASIDDPADYTTVSGLVTTGTYSGIVFRKYTEYFSSAWNIDTSNPGGFITATNPVSSQAILHRNRNVNGELRRDWKYANDDSKAYRLWMDENYKYYRSVGGYKLKEFKITLPDDSVLTLIENYIDKNKIVNFEEGKIYTGKAVYEKKMSFTNGNIKTTYTIDATEIIKFTTKASQELKKENITIDSEDINKIIGEKSMQKIN